MTFLIAVLVGVSVSLLVVLVTQLLPQRSATIAQRLAELEVTSGGVFDPVQRRARQARRERWQEVLRDLGERVAKPDSDERELRARLAHAGYRTPGAAGVFWGVRIALALVLLLATIGLVPFAGTAGLLIAIAVAGVGWIGPSFYLDSRIRKRQADLRRALPDTLDMMVTAVEAGLGLNQAFVRVAQEVRNFSPHMAEELALVNVEIRAGRPREEALRGLGERSGLDDLRSLTAMLIQTDRFGTSVVQALRVHAETMRTKRRQRAEEEAAKTTVKIVFPLLFCIFPALFVVLMGPAGIRIYEEMIKK